MTFRGPEHARDWVLRFIDRTPGTHAVKAMSLACAALAVMNTMRRGHARARDFYIFIDGISERYEELLAGAVENFDESEREAYDAVERIRDAMERGEEPE